MEKYQPAGKTQKLSSALSKEKHTEKADYVVRVTRHIETEKKAENSWYADSSYVQRVLD